MAQTMNKCLNVVYVREYANFHENQSCDNHFVSVLLFFLAFVPPILDIIFFGVD